MAEETKLCSNCKKDISAANFVMHEIHCRRHIVVCEHCDEPIHRSEIDQHFNDLHAKIPCDRCQQQICKPDMASHLEKDCIKKLMKCEYCDLLISKDELHSHMDYCGSRTECCPVCQQYIMLKDQLRHESSSCTYPEPKPLPQSQHIDPFSMEYLQQVVNGTSYDSPHSTVAAASMSNLRRGRNYFIRKSDLNAHRTRNVSDLGNSEDSEVLPPDMDYDTMLALQLAHEDWYSDENLGFSLQAFNDLAELDPIGRSVPTLNRYTIAADFTVPSEQYGSQHTLTEKVETDSGDDMEIPCEFCDALIPLSMYLEHTESCPMEGFRAHTNSADLNNEVPVSISQSISQATIPVINNLRSPVSHASPGNLINQTSVGLDGDVMLPCEFCEETFPSEIIFEHQSVCAASEVVTPQPTTPAQSKQNIQPQSPSKSRSVTTAAVVRSHPRRQPDPSLIDFVSDDGGDGGGNLRHRDLTRGTAGGFKNIDYKSYMGDDLKNRETGGDFLSHLRPKKVNESSSDKYSPALNRFDEAVARPPRRSSRQLNQQTTDEDDDSLSSPPWSDRRQNKSTQRARARLNQLLKEDQTNGAISSSRRQATPLEGREFNKAEPKDKNTRVDNRAVFRQLEPRKPRATPTRVPSSQNQSGQEDRSQPPTPRNRFRSDHVFSPELRLKSDHNPPPKK